MTSIYNISQLELGWMAGIIDGEGCMYMRHKKNSNFIVARFQVQACSYIMIKTFSDLLTKLGIHHIWKKRINKQKDYHRDSFILDIHTKKDILKFTRIFKDVTIEKRKQIILVNEYIEKAILKKVYHPTDRDKEIVDLVKKLKKSDIDRELLES